MNRKSLDQLALRTASSVTHRHLLSVINTKLKELPATNSTLRVLDIGCGNGLLLIYLQELLEKYHPALRVELYGFDVTDSKVQFDGFFRSTVEGLNQRRPDIHWESRLKIISSQDTWPYDDGFFDIAVSNQVGEHVSNHDWFFGQIHRVLRSDGFSIHLFPLKNYIVEGHMFLPFVHYFSQWNSKRVYIKIMSLLRIGRWKKMADKVSVDNFAESFADFLTYYCNYLSKEELLKKCKAAGFRAGFEFTGDMYRAKLRDLLKLPPKFEYRRSNLSMLSIHFYKWLASITLVLDKKDRYVNYIALHDPRAKKNSQKGVLPLSEHQIL
jgi:SAM-dependent methyltransferase